MIGRVTGEVLIAAGTVGGGAALKLPGYLRKPWQAAAAWDQVGNAVAAGRGGWGICFGEGLTWDNAGQLLGGLAGMGPLARKCLDYLPTGRAPNCFDAARFVGKQAVTSPHLPAGQYAALVVDGKVYVARMHNVAWELAGRKGVEQFYGFAEIDGAGKVVRLFR